MKKLIEHFDGWRWHEGNTSSAPFEKDGEQYTSLIEEGCEVEYLPQSEKDAYKAQELREQTNLEARSYLSSTDWYVTRNVETGEPVPQDVLVKRAEARLKVINV